MNGRYFLEIAYNGSAYHGWQVQHNALSIQEVLESCIEKIIGQKVATTASGRTDTGVHAQQQYVHIDLQTDMDKEIFLYKLNAVLPLDIVIKKVYKVKEEVNARYHALVRTYQYRIHFKKNPFLNDFSYFYPFLLDINKMNQACVYLMGEKDFKSFSKVKTGVTHFRCQIVEAEWSEQDGQYLFCISANRFLRGMVRAIVGSLLEVGRGTMAVQDFESILISKDRRVAGRAVPACGLYLSKIQYPTDIFVE